MFGAVRSQTGASLPLGFTGELTDPTTGFIDLRARDLDPSLGRFLSRDTVSPNAPGSQGYNPYAYVANNPATWTDPSGYSTNGDAAGTAGGAAAVSIFSLLLFTSLAAACLAFIGCGPFLVAGAVFSSTGGLLVLTGLLIAVFAEVACSLNAACYAATQQIGQSIKAYGSAAVAGAWSGGPGDARNAIDAFPVIPVVQSVINEYRYFTQRSKQHGQVGEDGSAAQQAGQSSAGDTISTKDLKKIRNDWIDQMGGESETAQLKKEYGGSLSDLYYDPQTGDIYAVRKGAREVPKDEVVANLRDYGISW